MSKALKKSAKAAKPGAILFVPLRKVDEEKRLVYGTAAQGDIVDRSDEVFDYDGSKPYFEKWSEGVAKASNGKSLGNVRAMHANKAAGKLTNIEFNDETKVIDICAKIVDDDEWNKVIEGVYTGFSIGGSYVKKWKDTDGNQRYIANPVEVSVVDLPCIPTATFDYAKADGSVTKMLFKAAKEYMPTAQDIAGRALEMATNAAQVDSWVDHIDAAREALISEASERAASRAERKSKRKGESEEGFEDEEAANEEADKDAKPGDDDSKAGDTDTDDDADADSDADSDADADKDDDEGKDDKSKAKSDDKSKAKKDDKKDEDDDAKKAAAKGDLVQVWKSTDGRTFAKKEDAAGHQADINARIAAHPLANALADLKKSLNGEATVDDGIPEVFRDPAKAAKALIGLAAIVNGGDEVQKSMYEVSSFARLLEEFSYIQSSVCYEAEYEGDQSPIPAALKQNIAQLAATFVELAIEESAELIARMKPEDVAELTDAGAGTADEITSTDGSQQVDPTDDPEVAVHAAEAAKFFADKGAERLAKAVGALPKEEPLAKIATGATEEQLAKFAETEAKLATVTAERDTLKKTLDDAVPAITELTAEVKKLKAEPAERGSKGTRTHIVEKGADRTGQQQEQTQMPPTLAEALQKMTPDQIIDLSIRASQQAPQQLVHKGQVQRG